MLWLNYRPSSSLCFCFCGCFRVIFHLIQTQIAAERCFALNPSLSRMVQACLTDRSGSEKMKSRYREASYSRCCSSHAPYVGSLLASTLRLDTIPYQGIHTRAFISEARGHFVPLRGAVIQGGSSAGSVFTRWMRCFTRILTLTLVGAVNSCSAPRLLVEAWAAAVTGLTAGVVLALTLESKRWGNRI